MRIFGFEFKKLDEAKNKGTSFRGGSLSSTGDMPETTMELFYKYYRKNSDIRRCIVELQETVGTGGYFFVNKKNNEEVEDVKLDIVLNSNQSIESMNRRIIRDVGVSGNAYVLKLMNAGGTTIGYQVLDPRTIAIVSDVHGDVVKYVQKVKGKTQEFTTDEIAHFIDEKDPDNEVFGLALLEGLINEVLADNEASLSNYYFFKNSTIPSTLVVLKDGISDDEKNNAIEQLKKQFRGGKNKHKIGVTTGIEKLEKLATDMKDMEFLDMRKFTTNRVCATYGVPQVVLNYTEGINYTNADIQYTKYIENTIRPRERKLEVFLTNLISELNENIGFKFKDKHINDAKEKTEILEKQINLGLVTVNEGRVELGLEKYEQVEEADEPLIMADKTKLTDVGLSDLSTNLNE